MDFDEGWSVSEDSLRQLIRATAFAVSTEESRPILNGVYWQLDDRMTMVATNGHRLAKMEVETAGARGAKDAFIVPPVALAQVERLFDGDGEITVGRVGTTWDSVPRTRRSTPA